MQYRRDIDGLRALAVLPVVLFHAGLPGFSGGYVGVDVFFVISGYLITGILYREAKDNRFGIWDFYERRVRRIFPALFAMLAVVLLAGTILLLPGDLISLGKSLFATGVFSSNILFWRDSGYFDSEAFTKPLLHTWSLAVEEQFYILFPLALWFMRRWPLPWLLGGLGTAAFFSFLLSILGTYLWPEATFYLLPTRAWELLLGSLIAVSPVYGHRGRQGSELLAVAGVLGILLPVLFYDESTRFPGAGALLPCLGAAAIIYGARTTMVARILSNRLPVGIGLISYSLYLWHWPLLSFVSMEMDGEPTQFLRAWAVIGSFVLAILSYRLVEQPFRRRVPGRAVLRFGVVCIAGGVVCGGALASTDGLPARYSGETASFLAEARREFTRLRNENDCALFSFDGDERFGPCPIGTGKGAPQIVVIGDSYSIALRNAADRAMRAEGVSGLSISAPGCPPAFGLTQTDRPDCLARLERIARYLAEEKPPAVLLIGSWHRALYLKDTIYRGRTSRDDATRLENLEHALAGTLAGLKANGSKVGFVLPTPGAHYNVPNGLARNRAGMEWTAAEHRLRFKPLKDAVAKLGFDASIDLADSFCPQTLCLIRNADGPLYVDSGHVNARGAGLAEPQLRAVVRALMGVVRLTSAKAAAEPRAQP
jgi:peptidoglycan/LPS O-acetylase OafA/YrhL